MVKSKVKRYALGDVVSSDDGEEEAANRSENAQSIMSEAKGDTMLKSMRDEAAKPKIVTKEELAKSGLSLRDYMNKMQGLSRRGGDFSKPSMVEKFMPKDLKESIAKEAVESIKSSGRKYPDMSVLQAPAKRAGMTAMGSGMKKGGMARSSASSRADGIATKGHTKGRCI